MKKLKLFFSVLMLLFVGIGQVWATETQITVSANPTTSGTFTISAVKSSGQNDPLVTSGLLRCYANNVITISTSGDANMTGMTIAWTKNGNKTFASVTASTGNYTHPSAAGNGTWSGSAKSVDFTVGSSGQIQITSVTITTEDGGTPTLSSIAVNTAPTKVAYTEGENFDPTGLVITRSYSNSTSDTYTYAGHTSDFSFSPSTSTALTTSNTSVTITYEGKSTTQAITVNAASSGQGGESSSDNFSWDLSKATYTTGTNEVTWSGTYATMHNSGTNATNYLGGDANKRTSSRFYKDNTLTITPAEGISISSVEFTATSEGYATTLQGSKWTNASAAVASTKVTVTPTNGAIAISANVGGTCGFTSVKVYYTSTGGSGGGDTPNPTLSLSPTSKEFETSGNSAQTIALTTNNFSSTINSVSCAFYSEAACTTSITRPSWVNEPTISNDKTQVSVNVVDNDGNARQTWMKITASDGSKSASAVFAISQKKYSVDYATLPFEYDGNGSGDLPNGLTNSGVGTYASSPAMKFDGTGDYILIKINAAPETLTYDIKGNSFSGGTFKVQQSADGETYTDLETYEELGDKQSESKTVASTTRYIKFIYTEKSSGNVALGNITISAYVESNACAAPTFDPADGTTFTGALDVVLTSTTEGATIYYTLNGNDPTTDSNVFNTKITITETTTIKAIAAKAGMDNSSVASATYTIEQPYGSIAEFISAAPSSAKDLQFTEEDNCVILALNTSGNNMYVQDASGKGIIIYNKNGFGDLSYAIGDRIVGVVNGKYSPYNGQPEMVEATFASGVTFTAATRPTPATVSALDDNAFNAHAMALVKISNLYYSTYSSNNYTFTTGASSTGTSYTIYNTFGAFTDKVMPETDVKCDITGILSVYQKNNTGTKTYQLLPVTSSDIVANADAPAPTFSPAGGVDADHAVLVDFNSVVTITAAANSSVDKTSEQIKSTDPVAVSVVASRDFYRDATYTKYYKGNLETITYDILGLDEIEGGTVTAMLDIDGDPIATAAEGAEVLLLVEADNEHFTFASISAKDADNATVEVEEYSAEDGLYMFTMPAKAVTISAIFNEDAKYALTFVAGAEGASGSAESINNSYYAGVEVTLPACPFTYDDNHRFAGWQIGNNTYAASAKFTMPAAATTATATWIEKPNFTNGDWMLVTDVKELTEGSYVIIADNEGTVAMKSHESTRNNCQGKSAEIASGVLTYDADFAAYEIKAGNKENTIALYDVEIEKYLYAASSTSNYMKAEETLSDNSSWTVSISSSEATLAAQGSNTRNIMRFNPNNGSPVFSCYASSSTTGTLVTLYKFYAPVPKITYDANTTDEVTNLPAVQRAENNKAVVANGPHRAGFNFTGWNSLANGKGDSYTVGTEYDFTEDITLYAQWDEIPAHHVKYNTSGSTGTIEPDENAYYAGDEVTVKSASGLSNAGHFFNGWVATYVDGESQTQTLDIEDDKFTMPDFDVTVTATWARKSDDKWIRVTAESQLEADYEYIIASTVAYPIDAEPKSYYAISTTQNANNRKATSVDVNEGILTGSSAMEIFVLKDAGSSMFAFKSKSNNKYLGTATGGNYLRSQDEIDKNSSWTIKFTDDVVSIVATNSLNKNVMQFNYASNNQIFSCYASASQKAVAIYKKAPKVEVNDGSATSDDVAGADVKINEGGTLTVDDDVTIGDLNIANGGKVDIEEGNTMTVTGTFTITATMGGGASGQITGATLDNITIDPNAEVFFDVTLGANARADQWHAFTVPFPVDAINGVYDLDNNKLVNEVNYAIMSYHGDIRANGQYGWKKFRDIMTPGTFYLMTVDGERTTYRFKLAPNSSLVAANSVSYTAYTGSGADADYGWNGLGNPTLAYGKVGVPVQVLDPVSYEFVTKIANSTNFIVGTPFFYKAGANGSIVMQTPDARGAYAPARSTANEVSEIEVAFGNDTYKDNLYISASEDALNSYEYDKDLVKMSMSKTPRVAQIYGKAYNEKLSMVHAPLCNNQATYDLTLYAPAAGEYTIAAPQMEDVDVYLTLNGAVLWNISMSPYTLDLQKGNTEDYGLLLQKHNAPQIATGIDNIKGTNNSQAVQKVIIDEHVYILRNGQRYDVTGKIAK